MQEDRDDHPMGSPTMQISQNFAIENQGQGLHIEVSPFNGGRIMEH
jgi:hypothetical protein